MLLRALLVGYWIWSSPAVATAQAAPNASTIDEDGPLFLSDVAGNRRQPLFDPQGIQVGPYRVFSSMRIATGFDSNILNAASGKNSDAFLLVEPALLIRTDWGRHLIELDASARITRAARRIEDNREEFGYSLSGRLDGDGDDAVRVRIAFRQQTEPRGAGGVPTFGAEPSSFDDLNIGIGTRQTSGSAQFSVAAAVNRRVYDPIRLRNGDRFDQSFRDVETIQITPRLDYALSSDTAGFVSVSVSRAKTINPTSFSDRTSIGGRTLGGVRGKISNLLIAEVGLGWQYRNYQSPLFKDYDGVAYAASIDWYPTPLLSFRLSTGQEFQNSGILSVAAIRNTFARLITYYEFRRNINVSLTIQRDRGSYPEIAVVTKLTSAVAKIDFDVSPRFGLGASFGVRQRGSSNADLIGNFGGVAASVFLTTRL